MSMADVQPPPHPPHYYDRRYSTRPAAGSAAPTAMHDIESLPRYTRRNTLSQPISAAARREPTEHSFYLMSSGGKPWASLKVFSSAKSAKSLPTFFEKENVNGSLVLDVDKSDGIQSVTATVTGRIITGVSSSETHRFLNLVAPIWSKAEGSRIPSPSEGANSSKLHGRCCWPLSIALPRTIPGSDGEPTRLPETFLERHTRASIQYDLTITIARGKLRADNQIKTAFGYVPGGRPEPPSMLRQVAYQQNLPLPGPDADPEGWKTLRPTVARGVLFKSRTTEVACTLSIAKPLCFSRGSILPLSLVLAGNDAHALDMMSTPSSVAVTLRRRVRFYNGLNNSRPELTWSEMFEDVGTAVWWPNTRVTNQNPAMVRYLEGEIRLAKDLKPSCSVGHFSISYSVVIMPFDVAGFTPMDSSPLLAEPVEIVTMHAKGPRAVAYSPPAYDPIPRHNADYYATLR